MFYEAAKRTVDVVASITLAILFLPVWIIIPFLIKLDSRGPIFFSQKRLGRGGKLFRLLKFRTMYTNADKFWTSGGILSEKAKKAGWKLTLNEDPRITRLGKILRQTSIDEFPQVFNILLGDMSLVGPRPIRDIEVQDALKRYGPPVKQSINTSLTVKPGLTGLWQVSGRNDIPWDKRVEMDADYARRKSLREDLVIMLKTPFAMISKW